jgi:hypothetical protein
MIPSNAHLQLDMTVLDGLDDLLLLTPTEAFDEVCWDKVLPPYRTKSPSYGLVYGHVESDDF